jgi:hypothetical protein
LNKAKERKFEPNITQDKKTEFNNKTIGYYWNNFTKELSKKILLITNNFFINVELSSISNKKNTIRGIYELLYFLLIFNRLSINTSCINKTHFLTNQENNPFSSSSFYSLNNSTSWFQIMEYISKEEPPQEPEKERIATKNNKNRRNKRKR